MSSDRGDLERVRQATNLVQLFEAITTVKRSGSSVVAICPFHSEKTPSLSIDVARGLYHCFGCDRGGDVFTFMQETQGLEFREALQMLADQAGITISKTPGTGRSQENRRQMLEALEEAGKFYHERFFKEEDATPAREYLRGRGYNRQIVEEFQIGFSPPGWDATARHLHDMGFPVKAIIAAGLAKRGQQGQLRDQIRGRLMFPIRNVSGQLVGFGGRALGDEMPKYLNTPETTLYKKGSLLYGLDRARSTISRTGQVVVVEGYTDVIAFHQADFPIAVATCGTALGKDHLQMLSRFAPQVILAFDPDQAGERAAIRGDDLRREARIDIDLRIAVMPPGQDPADLVREPEGAQRLRQVVEASAPMTEFHVMAVLDRYNLNEVESRNRAIEEAAVLIAEVKKESDREDFTLIVASHSGGSIERVNKAIDEARNRSKLRPSAKDPGRRGDPGDSSPASSSTSTLEMTRAEEHMVRHLLAGTAPLEKMELDLFSAKVTEVIGWLLETARSLPEGSLVPMEGDNPEMEKILRPLVMKREPLDPVEDLLADLEKNRRRRKRKELERQYFAAKRKKDPAEIERIKMELLQL